MACAITATAGSASANSYATIAEGDTYHLNHLYGSDWDDSDSDTKCRALQMATKLLDQWYDWAGHVTDNVQALLWPRASVVGRAGYVLANNTIPNDIRDGTIELARQLIADDRTAENATSTQGIKSLTAGPVSIEFRGDLASSKPIPDAVRGFVGFYGTLRGVSGGAVTMLRA